MSTTHALEWIAEHGRYLRTINAHKLRTATGRPEKHCTWCGQRVGKGLRTWCSDDCVQEFRQRTDNATIRRIVEQRDRGVCSKCGRDTLLNSRQAAIRAVRFYDVFEICTGRRTDCQCPACLFIREELHRWEADHIVPVVEGGGLCGPDGYRTLCVPCHKGVSAELAGRLATRRKSKKRELQEVLF